MIQKEKALSYYREVFGGGKASVYFSHGRLELLGNHTDHHLGKCLVAGCDMGITAAVAKNKDGLVEVASKGFRSFRFYLDELNLRKQEKGTSIAIVKGILKILRDAGMKIGGFRAALVSDIFPGAGVSSSAAFESLIVKIVDGLYNNNSLTPLQMAKVAQRAENEYFGKPSGLLDQIGTSFGGVKYIDFSKEGDEMIKDVPFDLPLAIVLVNTGGSHADLTPLYAAIPADMSLVAKEILGVKYLSQADKQTFFRLIGKPTLGVSERAKLRATHFFDECERVDAAKKALEENDAVNFLALVTRSQESSMSLLANTMVPCVYDHSPQQGVDIAKRFIGLGAVRIMGGGFAGSIICFVPKQNNNVKEFMTAMAHYYGEAAVKEVRICKDGPVEVA